MDQLGPHFGRDQTSVGRARSKSGPTSVEIGPSVARCGTGGRPRFGQLRADSDQISASLGQLRLDMIKLCRRTAARNISHCCLPAVARPGVFFSGNAMLFYSGATPYNASCGTQDGRSTQSLIEVTLQHKPSRRPLWLASGEVRDQFTGRSPQLARPSFDRMSTESASTAAKQRCPELRRWRSGDFPRRRIYILSPWGGAPTRFLGEGLCLAAIGPDLLAQAPHKNQLRLEARWRLHRFLSGCVPGKAFSKGADPRCPKALRVRSDPWAQGAAQRKQRGGGTRLLTRAASCLGVRLLIDLAPFSAEFGRNSSTISATFPATSVSSEAISTSPERVRPILGRFRPACPSRNLCSRAQAQGVPRRVAETSQPPPPQDR